MLFSRQQVNEMRSSCFELNGSELDSIILGQLSAFGSVCSSVGISSRHSPKEREKSDLCWQCQQNSTAITRSTNMPEWEKSATLLIKAEEHLHLVQVERSFYKTTCDFCKVSIHAFSSEANSFNPPPLASNISENTNNIKAHYSFDYAQQVHYPSASYLFPHSQKMWYIWGQL